MVEPLLVLEAIFAIAEALELRDVGSGDERLATRAAKNDHAHGGVTIDAVARVDERLVHLPCHRVARFGAIERQDGERAVCLEDSVHNHMTR